MQLAIQITVNIIWIPLVCALFFLAGFIFRSSQLRSLKDKAVKLESEILDNHAEILSLQKEITQFHERTKENPAPVIPIQPKESGESLPETGSRNKKMLGKSAANQHP